MSTHRRFLMLLPLLFLFSLLVVHAAAHPNSEIRNTPIQVEAGRRHTCGLRVNGTLQCWGSNDEEQTTLPADLGTVKAVSAGGAHTCAIKSNDMLACWGWNNEEQTTLPADLGTVKAVSAGGAHTCAIKSNDMLACWGWNNEGQTTLPADLGTVKAVNAGFSYTCAIKSNDMLACWGRNNEGQTTLPADLGTVKAVSGGRIHTCAIKSDDTLSCWGNNSFEQTTLPADLGTVKAVSGGDFHTCAIKSDDTLVCWGVNDDGQTTLPADLGTVKAVSAGGTHTCAIKSDDTFSCWGINNDGQTTVPQSSISLSAPSLVLIEGSTLTIKVNASDYSWTNLIVSLNYSGTATLTSDFTAASAVFMTTSDNFADLVITTVDDNQIEVDETIIIDITSVTGGIESGTQQVILVTQDNDDLTPVPTPPLETNVLINSDFENGQTGWTVKRGGGDKVKCNKEGKPPVAKSGTCAFQFKGGAGEQSSVEQTLTGQTWAVGNTLSLSAWVKATNSAANGKIKVRVKYSDGTATGKIAADIVQSSEYTELTGSHTLLSANVSKVKLSIQNRSATGKVLVDDVVLAKGGTAGLIALP